MNQPTPAGRLLWPCSDGYLHVKGAHGDARLACTCRAECVAEECHGTCGCGACALAWLIHQDDHALWNDQGQLVTPEALENRGRAVPDPRQLKLRFERRSVETPHG